MGSGQSIAGPIPRVALIGCGRIGSLWDEVDPGGPIRSHAGAWQRNPRARLAALCDADPERLRQAGQRRGIQACYQDFRELLAAERPDILSLCTGPECRLEPIQAALEAGTRLVLCEKPLAPDLATAQMIIHQVESAGAQLAVAHLRRWAPGIRAAAEQVRAGQIGTPQWAVAHYDKGLHNNGSHLLDLISQFLGLPTRITPLSGGREPGPHGDPTLDLLLHLPGAGGEFPAYLIGSDHRAFSLFELDILGTGGRLTLADKGQQIHLQVAADDPNWPGYRKLAPALVQPGGMSECWTRLTGELVEIHAGRVQAPACGGPQALAVMTLLEAARLAWQRGAPVSVEEVLS